MGALEKTLGCFFGLLFVCVADWLFACVFDCARDWLFDCVFG